MKTETPKHPIDIGEVIHDALVFNPRSVPDERNRMDEVSGKVESLFEMLEARKIEHVLVGGLAMLQYVDGRNTKDIDLIVSAEALRSLPEVKIIEQDQDFARCLFEDVRLDFLFTRHKLFDLVMKSYSSIQPFKGRQIPCATREGMLLLKLYALPSLYRQGRLQRAATYEHDVQMLLLSGDVALEPLFKILGQSLSNSDLTEVRRIAEEIQARIRHF